MYTRTAPHGLSHPLPRFATQLRIPATGAPRASWMDRLAAWAERQPAHHRIGSYGRFR